jgi:hypothetical protein
MKWVEIMGKLNSGDITGREDRKKKKFEKLSGKLRIT